LGREPFQFAPQVVAEMTIPQAMAVLRDIDDEEKDSNDLAESRRDELYKGTKTVKFDNVNEFLAWKVKNDGVSTN